MMKKISKKKIRSTIEGALNRELVQLKITFPSKKTKRTIRKASKELSGLMKGDLKKQVRKSLRASKPAVKKVRTVRKVSAKPKPKTKTLRTK